MSKKEMYAVECEIEVAFARLIGPLAIMNELETYKNIHEEDIWNYLVESNWKKKHDWQLCDLISDILFANNIEINNYVTNRMQRVTTQNDNNL